MIYGEAFKLKRDNAEDSYCTIVFDNIINEVNNTVRLGNSKLTLWFKSQPHNAARCKIAKDSDDIDNGKYEEVFYEDKIRYKHGGDKIKHEHPDSGNSKLNKNIEAAAIRYEQPMRLLKQDNNFKPEILEKLVQKDFKDLESKKIKKISGRVEVTKNKNGSYEMREIEE